MNKIGTASRLRIICPAVLYLQDTAEAQLIPDTVRQWDCHLHPDL